MYLKEVYVCNQRWPGQLHTSLSTMQSQKHVLVDTCPSFLYDPGPVTLLMPCTTFHKVMDTTQPEMRASISPGSLIADVRFSLPLSVTRTLSSMLTTHTTVSPLPGRGAPVFLPNAAHVPVLVQDGRVNVLAVLGVIEIRLDDEVAKVDLRG